VVQLEFVTERIKGMLARISEERLKRLASATTELKARDTTTTPHNAEADFEAVVASEGVRKAAERTRSHGAPSSSSTTVMHTTAPNTAAGSPGSFQPPSPPRYISYLC
jgi:hypothetical protein